MKFLTRFREFVNREQLFSPSDNLLVAVSGGLDSTVLATLLSNEGYHIGIAHVNFQLRGAESDRDAEFVNELARSLDARCHTEAVYVEYGPGSGQSTQTVARDLRYRYFEKILDEYGYDYIVLAHHLDDQLETFAINFIRGTGIAGLAAMLPASGPLRRPFLTHSRTSITAYAELNNIEWREDASNKSDDYLRNRIRHQLTPLFSELGLTEGVLRRNFRNLRRGQAGYDLHLAQVRKECTVPSDGLLTLNLRNFQHSDLLETYLWEYLKNYGLNQDHIKQLLGGGRNNTLPIGKYQLHRTDWTFTVRQRPRSTPSLPLIFITTLPYTFTDGRFEYLLQIAPKPTQLDNSTAQFMSVTALVNSQDGDSLTLHLRPRKNGDRFSPLGMNGSSKKVKEYLVDKKVPRELRDFIYLLTDETDEILAIVGMAISERARVCPEESEVLQLSRTKTKMPDPVQDRTS